MLNEKYRPKVFEDVIGQEVSIEILKNIIKTQEFRPLLFIGNSGVGKTTVARIFCNQLNAEIIELDASTNGGVEDIRKIIQDSRLQSLTNKYKVFLIDECHCLSSSAWSSFLLELEYKKKNVLYIFLTTETHRIPETIMSRLVSLNFHSISSSLLYKNLLTVSRKESIDVDRRALEYISVVSKGNVRQSLSYLEKCQLLGRALTLNDVLNVIKIKDSKFIKEFLNSDTKKQVEHIQHLLEQGYDLEDFIGSCLNYVIKMSLKEDRYSGLIDVLVNLKSEIRDEVFAKEIIIARLWSCRERLSE